MINNGPPLRTIQDTVTHTLEKYRRCSMCKIIWMKHRKQTRMQRLNTWLANNHILFNYMDEMHNNLPAS